MKRLLSFAAALGMALAANAQSIFTVAGGPSEDGRSALFAVFRELTGIAVNPAGDVFVVDADKNTVRKIDRNTGIITTVAGDGSDSAAGDGGPAVLAGLRSPHGIAFDSSGNLFIADYFNARVRRVDAATGVLTTIAGGGTRSPSDGMRATDAQLSAVYDVAIDPSGTIHFFGWSRVWKIAGGFLTTVAGTSVGGDSGDGGPATAARLSNSKGLAFDAAGNLYIADNNRIRKVEGGIIRTVVGGGGSLGDGGPATAAQLNNPRHITFDPTGNLYIADSGNRRIRKVSTNGVITTIAGGGNALGDGGLATAAGLREPRGVALDKEGNLLIADYDALANDRDPVTFNRVRKVDLRDGTITTIGGGSRPRLGDGGLATAATFYRPTGVAMDSRGNIYVADQSNFRIRRIDPISGFITSVAGTGKQEFTGDGGPAIAAGLELPRAIAIDSADNILIADDSRIRMISGTTGIIRTIGGEATDGYRGDGGPATLARFYNPYGMAVDSARNIYIADTDNFRVRKITAATGIVETIAGTGAEGYVGDGGPATAARLHRPRGIAVDAGGNVFISFSGSSSENSSEERVRRIDAVTKTITTVAGTGNTGDTGDGGPATLAKFRFPRGVAIDASGNLFIADLWNNRIRRVKNGVISTYAGNGRRGASGDQGAATGAAVGQPHALAIDSSGALYVTQDDYTTGEYRVRIIPPCLPSIAAPQLLSPSNGSTGVSTAPNLRWRPVVGAQRYDIYIDTVNPPKQLVAGDLGVPTFSPSNLDPLQTYFWQVVAKGDRFCTPIATSVSEIRSFTARAECAAPGPMP